MDKYIFRPYNPIFPNLFEKEKKRLEKSISEKNSIEHIGSTAIPNAGGKGIIDIMMAVEDNLLPEAVKQIQAAGYEFREVASIPSRLFFRKDMDDPVDGIRRYHIHLTQTNSQDWKEAIQFRDYLRSHPEKVEKYNILKRKAVKQANQDGSIYKKTKEPFIEEMLNLS